jgi:hypothetical protein
VVSEIVYNDVPFPDVSPNPPCVDILRGDRGGGGYGLSDPGFILEPICGAIDDTENPEGCDDIEIENFSQNPCTKFNGTECFNDPWTWEAYLMRVVTCCNYLPEVNPDTAAFVYGSEEFDCNDIPEEMELTLLSDAGDITIDFSFPSLSSPYEVDCDEPADIVYTIPSTITLSIAK